MPTPSNTPSEPVPITVWPATAAPEQGLCERMLATYTRPGELTVAINPSPALIIAAATDGFRLAGLTTRRADADGLARLADQHAPAHRRARLRIQHITRADLPQVLARSRARVGLIVAPADTPAAYLTAAAAGLSATGFVILATGHHGPWSISRDQRDALHAEGLRYLQHVVCVHAAVDGDRWQTSSDRSAGRAPAGGSHSRIHHDLYVYTGGGRG
jgi:hypothetical protein